MTNTHDFELLGPSEKFVAGQLRDAIVQAREAATKLTAALDEMDLDQIEPAMLDAKRKESVMMVVTLMQGLAKNLGQSELTTIVAGVVLKEKAPA